MASKRKAAKQAITKGRSRQPIRARYPWDSLKTPGAWFKVKQKSAYNSVRAQASKQGKSRHVRYSVSMKADGVVVRYDGPVDSATSNSGIEVHTG